MLRGQRGHQLLSKIELDEVFNDQGLVFPGPLGGLLDPSVVTRNFKKLARKAGHPGIRLQDLRHALAAGLIKAGGHPRVVEGQARPCVGGIHDASLRPPGRRAPRASRKCLRGTDG